MANSEKTENTENPMRSSRSPLCLLLFTLAALQPSATAGVAIGSQEPAPLADSVRDFSGVQGANGWSYGFWDQSADDDGTYHPTADFQLLPRFGGDPINGLSGHDQFTTGQLWSLEDGRFYTSLWARGGHPHGTMDLGAYAKANHWVVRRWVSTVDSVVEIRGHAGKTMPWGENWGGDVVFQIVVGGSKVYEAVVDDGGGEYSATVEVETGTTVDFLIGPGTAIGVVDFTAVIRGSGP